MFKIKGKIFLLCFTIQMMSSVRKRNRQRFGLFNKILSFSEKRIDTAVD